jgi:hypothetical protein
MKLINTKTSGNNKKTLESSGIRYAKHKSKKTINQIQKIVGLQFPNSVEYYSVMGVDEYRNLVSLTQEVLCNRGYVRKIVDEIYPEIIEFLQESRFLIQTNIYLRATRPQVFQDGEAIGWHRESFYGLNMERSINIWTPISGVVIENTLRFVPESQSIPEDQILTEQVEDKITLKYSIGHKIGFQYAPKRIVGGVDIVRSEPMDVPSYHSSIFPGNLVHGAAYNKSDQIRFSIDFRILPISAYNSLSSKNFHFASGKSYFEEF